MSRNNAHGNRIFAVRTISDIFELPSRFPFAVAVWFNFEFFYGKISMISQNRLKKTTFCSRSSKIWSRALKLPLYIGIFCKILELRSHIFGTGLFLNPDLVKYYENSSFFWTLSGVVKPSPSMGASVQLSCNPTTAKESQLFFQAKWRGLDSDCKKFSFWPIDFCW